MRTYHFTDMNEAMNFASYWHGHFSIDQIIWQFKVEI